MQQIGFLLQNLLFAQHVSGNIMPIIRSPRWWLLPMVLGALVYRSLVWRGAVGYVSRLRDAARVINFAVKNQSVESSWLFISTY